MQQCKQRCAITNGRGAAGVANIVQGDASCQPKALGIGWLRTYGRYESPHFAPTAIARAAAGVRPRAVGRYSHARRNAAVTAPAPRVT